MNKLFSNIQLQTRQECNLRCSFCPNSYIEQTGKKMTLKLYKKILLELKELSFDGRIALYLMNEPLLDDRIVKFILYARELLKNEIMISTNGILLTEELAREMLSTGMSGMLVSCYKKEIYNKVQSWGIKQIECNRFFEQDLKAKFYNRGGNIDIGEEAKHKICDRPFVQMYIKWNGDAVLCCSDYKSEVIMGNVKKEKLIDIWNCDKYNMYRKELTKGNKSNLLLCKTCNY